MATYKCTTRKKWFEITHGRLLNVSDIVVKECTSPSSNLVLRIYDELGDLISAYPLNHFEKPKQIDAVVQWFISKGTIKMLRVPNRINKLRFELEDVMILYPHEERNFKVDYEVHFDMFIN